MLPVRNFYGQLHGVNTYDFLTQLDYNLNQDERIQKTKDILYTEQEGQALHPYWEEVFIQEHKDGKNVSHVILTPNTNQALSEEINVCKCLERMADYILFSPDAEKIDKKVKYNFYTKEQFEEKLKKTTPIDKQSEETIDYLIRNENYKKDNKQVITWRDFDDSDCGQALTSYKRMLDVISTKYPEKKKVLSPEIKKDMLTLKDKLKGTIYFKHVTPDSTDMQMEWTDYADKETILSILACTPTSVKNDIGVLIYDIEKLIEKCNFSEEDKKIISLLRIEGITQEDIAVKMNTTQPNINFRINKIINKIIKEYFEEHEDWYYLNRAKGTYKKCQRCGEIRLISKYYKRPDTKDGYYNFCKKCMVRMEN